MGDKKLWVLVILWSVCGSNLWAEVPNGKKMLIIGIDGCRPDALKQAKTPHLDTLAQSGAYSYTTQSAEKTVSGPCWSSMLTGVWPAKHHVQSNQFEQPQLDKFPHFFRYLKSIHSKAITASIVYWGPINEHIIRDTDHTAHLKTDAAVADTAVNLLGEDDLDAVFLHFDEVDGAGHGSGFHPENPAYIAKIEHVDTQVGKVHAALKGRKNYVQEKWLIIVSTDHGGSERSHGKNIPSHRTIFLIVSGAGVHPGEIKGETHIVDVAVTALVHLDVPLDKKWQLDGRPRGLAANWIAK